VSQGVSVFPVRYNEWRAQQTMKSSFSSRIKGSIRIIRLNISFHERYKAFKVNSMSNTEHFNLILKSMTPLKLQICDESINA